MEPDTQPDCLSELTLLRYVQGELGTEDAREAELHLDKCSDCLAIVAVLGGRDRPHRTATARGRYELGDPIARGGMGRISSAWDRILERPVALKTVRVADAVSRERFAREMVVTARLQHPAIVPVYDGGELDDGTPFYAMRRVDGRELEACIADAGSLSERLELIRPYVALVDAVAYAHAEGFIHRDLKPRNVLVGPFGETVVLDWGLARELNAPDPVAPSRSSTADSKGDLTATGAVMGTPGYIAPELAAGGPSSPRADVYSLGVILARILTGEAPDRAARLRDGSLVGAPGDLVAIARRATASSPDLRYADAGGLAEDLRRFEAGRRVAARSYGFVDRVVRMVQRHRAAFSVAAVALAALLGSGAWSYRNLSRARAATETALEQAQVERTRAEHEREAAEELIDFGLEDLSKALGRAGQTELLAGLIAEVDAYYQGRGNPDDPPWALRRAKALALRSQIEDDAGEAAASSATADEAEAFLLEASRDPALTEDADFARCELLRSRAMRRHVQGDYDGAHESAAAAIGIALRYAEGNPTSARWQRALAVAEFADALGPLSRGQTAEAETRLKQILARTESKHWQGVSEEDVLGLRRLIDGRLGMIALRDERSDDAIEHLGRALRDCRRLQELQPGNVLITRAVAGAHMELGAALASRADWADARRELELAIGVYEVLAALGPAASMPARNLANARRQLTTVLLALERGDDAMEVARSNVAFMRALAEQVPDDLPIRMDLGFVLVDLGDVAARLDRPAEAGPPFEEGLAVVEDVVARDPDNMPYLRKLGFARLLHGDFELGRGDLETAATSFERARALAKIDLERHPSGGNRLRVAEPTARLVEIRWRQGRHEGARALVAEVREAVAAAQAEGADSRLADQLLDRIREPARALGLWP